MLSLKDDTTRVRPRCKPHSTINVFGNGWTPLGEWASDSEFFFLYLTYLDGWWSQWVKRRSKTWAQWPPLHLIWRPTGLPVTTSSFLWGARSNGQEHTRFGGPVVYHFLSNIIFYNKWGEGNKGIARDWKEKDIPKGLSQVQRNHTVKKNNSNAVLLCCRDFNVFWEDQ